MVDGILFLKYTEFYSHAITINQSLPPHISVFASFTTPIERPTTAEIRYTSNQGESNKTGKLF